MKRIVIMSVFAVATLLPFRNPLVELTPEQMQATLQQEKIDAINAVITEFLRVQETQQLTNEQTEWECHDVARSLRCPSARHPQSAEGWRE
jgi:hypothetical protein